AESRAQAVKSSSRAPWVALGVVLGIILFFSWAIQDNRQQNASNARAAVVVPTRADNAHAQIWNTMARVARDLDRGRDVNGDGQINCIDAAVLFYQHFPFRGRVRIMRNINHPVDFNHLFNAVLINGRWITVEPQAYWSDWNSFAMCYIWGDLYNPRLSRNETAHWRRYVR
ncbi:MAG: hypothetical protein FWD88_03010, partial [Treponema sp.]|nr:hypothetical protein [Treponema sp.]